MINLETIVLASALVTVAALWWRSEQLWTKIADALEADRELGWTKLHALRRNCFVTNEKGHRRNPFGQCRSR